MKKIALVSILAIGLVGWGPGFIEESYASTYRIECFDGIRYLKITHGQVGYMAVKINKDTLQPERCGD